MAQGAPTKVAADVASIGVSTLQAWLQLSCKAVAADVQPHFMPSRPYDAAHSQQVHQQFASRRGLPNVAMACD
eukprot:3785715-Pleurochrysis_carterae.AAC.1